MIMVAFSKPGIWPFTTLALKWRFSIVICYWERTFSLDGLTISNKLNMICQKSSRTSKASLTPEVCPFCKARPRCEHKRRKMAKSCILTITPEEKKLSWKKWKQKWNMVEREWENRRRMKEDRKLQLLKKTILSIF